MIKENVKATGRLNILLTGPDGAVKKDIEIPNVVVDTGKAWIAARFADTSIPAQMTLMSVGTNTLGDYEIANGAGGGNEFLNTTLGSEVAGSSTALSTAGGTPVDNAVTFNCTFPPGTGDGALVEAGIFNAAATMLCRTTFDVINKGAQDTLTITWTVTIN